MSSKSMLRWMYAASSVLPAAAPAAASADSLAVCRTGSKMSVRLTSLQAAGGREGG